MSKGIELTPSQIKAYENGAVMFIFPVASYMMSKDYIYNPDEMLTTKEEFTDTYFPIQKGDKDIFVKEEFFKTPDDIKYKARDYIINGSNKIELWINASQMTKEQSRYSFSECIDVRVIRVQDIEDYEIIKIVKGFDVCDIHEEIEDDIRLFYNQQMQELNINRTYDDNDYVFLVEFKK